MNAPDRFELFVLPDGVKKVNVEYDQKISNAASFTIQKEDHTLGNLLRAQLLKDPKVLFAGYKVPHPLEHSFTLRVQTKGDSSPQEALQRAIEKLIRELGHLKNRFENDVVRAQAFSSSKESGIGEVDLQEDMHARTVDMDF
ncbi:uncharacterized protein VTP21DRAFT_8387 [Calcarisporiella thermophila]|uniref:uncharacterized protein n=1 Tax=Calcarisporiella thermophila TaxID=911321 RepID=UPI00374400DB